MCQTRLTFFMVSYLNSCTRFVPDNHGNAYKQGKVSLIRGGSSAHGHPGLTADHLKDWLAAAYQK